MVKLIVAAKMLQSKRKTRVDSTKITRRSLQISTGILKRSWSAGQVRLRLGSRSLVRAKQSRNEMLAYITQNLINKSSPI